MSSLSVSPSDEYVLLYSTANRCNEDIDSFELLVIISVPCCDLNIRQFCFDGVAEFCSESELLESESALEDPDELDELDDVDDPVELADFDELEDLDLFNDVRNLAEPDSDADPWAVMCCCCFCFFKSRDGVTLSDQKRMNFHENWAYIFDHHQKLGKSLEQTDGYC